MKTLGPIVAVSLLLAAPGNAWARTGWCFNAPGFRYPVVDWRAANGGVLPQTHTLTWREDTITLTIEDGVSQNVLPNQMVVTLRLPSASIARKQIAAWNPSGYVASITAEPGNIGPASMRITRAPHCGDFGNTHTIVFRKVDSIGNMRDVYHLDIDHFWSNLGGKILSFNWSSEYFHDPTYPPKYLVPYEIPVDRNLGAVSRTFDRTDLYENRNGSLVHSWIAAGAQWLQQNLGPMTQGYWSGQWYDVFAGRWRMGWLWNPDPEPMNSSASVSTDGTYINMFTRNYMHTISSKWSDGNQVQWSEWEDLAKNRPYEQELITSAPASVSWGGSDRVDVFARGTDFAMWHRWWDGAQWTAWESLGGGFTSGPAAVSRGPNRLDVFGRGGDGAVWMNSWTGTQWTGWSSLGGVITSDPAAVVYGPERIAVFARGTDNALWVTVNNGSGWLSGWGSLGGVITSAPALIGRWDHIDVFVRGDNGEIFQKTWNSPTWNSPGGGRGHGGQAAHAGSLGWGDWTTPPLPACNGNGC
jgi:hypothetical protein